MARRAVITGLGLVTPLGAGVKGGGIEGVWQRLLNGDSGANPIEKFDVSDLPCKIAAEVPHSDGRAGGAAAGALAFNADEWVSPKEQRRLDNFIVYGLAASDMAIEDAGITDLSEAEKERAGVMIGSGIGGLESIEKTTIELYEKGPRKVSPFFIPSALINLVSGNVSIKYGLKGPNHSAVTACATGVHAIGDAARLIMYGDADIMLAGGAEASVCRLGISGFAACKALTTGFNETPEKASRPYDSDRDGFLMGEGSGVVVIEEYERAVARGAKIYGEIVGYGMSGDAYHITAPAEDGDGGYRAMSATLKAAGMTPDQIDYINAHGTSTPKGDEIELRAVERLFAGATDNLVMSSTKSSTGHLLGAAGAIEAIFSILAMRDNVAPPTINLDNPSVETKINLAANRKVEKNISAVLSNSFGFGGTNASIIIREV